jgi:hypothetical protein
MTKPFFTRDRTGDFETFGRHADEAIHIIRSQGHSPIDFQDLVSRFTMDAATEFLFGSCVHTLSLGDGGALEPFAPAFGRLQYQLAQRVRSIPLWPIFEMWKDKTEYVRCDMLYCTVAGSSLLDREDLRTIHDFIRPIIQDALERKQSLGGRDLKKDTDLDRQTLLDHLVALTDGE